MVLGVGPVALGSCFYILLIRPLVIPYGDGQWLVNHWIDLLTFNNVY